MTTISVESTQFLGGIISKNLPTNSPPNHPPTHPTDCCHAAPPDALHRRKRPPRADSRHLRPRNPPDLGISLPSLPSHAFLRGFHGFPMRNPWIFLYENTGFSCENGVFSWISIARLVYTRRYPHLFISVRLCPSIYARPFLPLDLSLSIQIYLSIHLSIRLSHLSIPFGT